MSQSHELQLHIEQLKEIRSILNAMKDLAFMEVHKLQRFQNLQRQVVTNIEAAANDFLAFYADLLIEPSDIQGICIVLGAERGFCGDFNDSLLAEIAKQPSAGIIAVGRRLAEKLADDTVLIAALEGANFAEEIPKVLTLLLSKLGSIAYEHTHISILYHEFESNQIKQQQLFPPFNTTEPRQALGYPPVLNLEPTEFLSNLIEQYVFAALHEVFYISLTAENYCRLQHLEGAIKHLDDETIRLHRKSQIYRQEEITEEIEVILLNTKE